MKQTRWIMGMPVTISIVGSSPSLVQDAGDVFTYFSWVDSIFSTYKKTSEISQINANLMKVEQASPEVREIFRLAQKTNEESFGYFDIYRNNICDPSGIVKGWAIQTAAEKLHKKGYKHFYVDAGGDIQTSGLNEEGEGWTIGIRNPFDRNQIVKRLYISGCAIATSGVYIRGQHIYNPFSSTKSIDDIVSITVVGKQILDADRFATAAFAMGKGGIQFIEKLHDFEGYMIDSNCIATYTSGFQEYVIDDSHIEFFNNAEL